MLKARQHSFYYLSVYYLSFHTICFPVVNTNVCSWEWQIWQSNSCLVYISCAQVQFYHIVLDIYCINVVGPSSLKAVSISVWCINPGAFPECCHSSSAYAGFLSSFVENVRRQNVAGQRVLHLSAQFLPTIMPVQL